MKSEATRPAGKPNPVYLNGQQQGVKLLDRVRNALRVGQYALETEKTYVDWIKQYIFFHGKRHPEEMGALEVEQFLTHLAVKRKVAKDTQRQALNALVFLYRTVLGRELGKVMPVRGRHGKRLPVVLTRKEVPGVLQGVEGGYLFPSNRLSVDPREPQEKIRRRHHVHVDTLEKAIRAAAKKSGLTKRVTPHVFRHYAACRIMPTRLLT